MMGLTRVRGIFGHGLLALGGLTAMLALGAGLVPGVANAAESARDAGAVRQLFSDFSDAFNRHDAQAVAALCAPDIDFIVVGGDDIRGRDAVVAHLQPLYAGRLRTVTRSTSVREVRFLRPDVAIIVASYETSGMMGPNGNALPPTKGVYDWVVVRRAGQWRIALWHEANLPMQAPRP